MSIHSRQWSPPWSRRPPLRLVVPLLLAAFVALACDGRAPSASPSTSPTPPVSAAPTPSTGDPSGSPAGSESPLEIYRRIEDQVIALRGLEASHVEPQIVSPEELDEIVRAIVEEETPPEELAKAERLYKALGLLPADESLDTLLVELLETQVAGLYDPVAEELYVLSKTGEVGPVEQVYFAHEFEHALQDQNFDLEALQDLPLDQGDRALARQALAEGDAYVLMTQWMIAHLGAEGIRALLESSQDPEAMEALERIPPIVREQILFPATQGLAFVQTIQLAGGWEAVNDAFRSPPESTEQILHPEKYEAGEAPIEVSVADDIAAQMGAGWSEVLRDTLGENQLRVILSADGIRGSDAVDAAAGWGGDRLVFLANGDRTAVAIVTEWDTAADADEFVDVARAALDVRELRGSVAHQPGSTRVAVFVASDDEALAALDRILGLTGA